MPSTSSEVHSTTTKATRSLMREFTPHVLEASSDDESGRLIIDESVEQHNNDEGWTTINSRSRCGLSVKFELRNQDGNVSAYQAVTALESEHSTLELEMRPHLASEYIPTTKDDESASLL